VKGENRGPKKGAGREAMSRCEERNATIWLAQSNPVCINRRIRNQGALQNETRTRSWPTPANLLVVFSFLDVLKSAVCPAWEKTDFQWQMFGLSLLSKGRVRRSRAKTSLTKTLLFEAGLNVLNVRFRFDERHTSVPSYRAGH
jgi:hypothetical protein